MDKITIIRFSSCIQGVTSTVGCIAPEEPDKTGKRVQKDEMTKMYGNIYEHYEAGLNPPEATNDSLWFVFSSGRLLINTNGNHIPMQGELKEALIRQERALYLGLLDDRPCYCVNTDCNDGGSENLSFRELRSLFGVLEESEFLLAGKAAQIIHWDLTSRFCGRCGHKNEDKADERAKICPECGLILYPRISPAVIMVVVREQKILLAHSNRFKSNMYSLIAGFVEPGETLEDAVQREIMEEVGIRVTNIRYFSSQPWPYPDSLMIGFIADYAGGEIRVDGVEIHDAGWYGNGDYPELPSRLSISRRLIDWYFEHYDKTVSAGSRNCLP